MQSGVAVLCILSFLAAPCDGVDQGADREDPGNDVTSTQQLDAPPPAESLATMQTDEGVAAQYLEVHPPRVQPHEDVSIRLENRGDVELLTGLDYAIEQWDGRRWVHVFTPEVPAVGLGLAPGDAGVGEAIPDWPGQFRDASDPVPGIYRVTKSATYEGPSNLELGTDAHFEIVP